VSVPPPSRRHPIDRSADVHDHAVDVEDCVGHPLRTVAAGPPAGATIGWWRRHTPHDEHAWLLAFAVELRDEVARQLVAVHLIGILDAIRIATPIHEISRRLRRLADETDFPDPRKVTSCTTTISNG
jgi:hypothetical protein